MNKLFILFSICIASLANASTKIIGGEFVKDLDLISATTEIGCSGFIVERDYVFTARHCTNSLGYIGYPVVLHLKNDAGKLSKVNCKTVSDQVLSPDSDKEFFISDFKFAKISCPKEVLSKIKYFVLPENPLNQNSLSIAGYGLTSLSGDGVKAPNLKMVTLNITDAFEEILRRFEAPHFRRGFQTEVTQMMNQAREGKTLCQDIKTIEQTPIFGDSGGPVFVTEDGKYIIHSVQSMIFSPTATSNGSEDVRGIVLNCGPNLYYYADWIREQMMKL